MSEWPEYQLGDLVRFRNGRSFKPNGAGTIPVYGSNGIIGTSSEYMYDNAIVIGRVGAYCGSIFLCDGRFWATDNTIVVESEHERCQLKFLYYLLKFADLNQHAGGAAQPLLTQTNLRALRYRIPNLAEQRHIASILGAYDDLIEVNRRRIALLEEVARGQFEEWFVRFQFPGYEEHPITEAPEGPLPLGWCYGTLGDLVGQRRETTSPGPHLAGRAYVPIECIGKRTLALTETRPWEDAQSSLQLFEKYDILFGSMRAYFHKVVPAPVAGITRSTCFVLRPKTPSLFSFATLALFRDETVAYAAAHSAGSTIPYAQWGGSLERLQIALPPNALMAEFDRLVRPILEQIMVISDTCNVLASTRDLLLPRLISGELSATTAERDLEAAA